MNEHHTETVATTLVQVLEDVAMMFGDEVSADEVEVPTGESLAFSIAFSGPENGTLELVAPFCTAVEVAANILGLEPEDSEVREGALDALKELLNVTLGQLLTAICGSEAVFDLSPPCAKGGLRPAEWSAFLAKEGAVAVVADEQPLLLCLELTPRVPLGGCKQ